MGMFDYFRSGYELGEHFTNTECQTKDIEDSIGGTMTVYWLDPSGSLWKPDYTGTSKLNIYQEGDPEYDPDRLWLNHEWIPTGTHGKLSVFELTKYIEVHPSNWRGDYKEWPQMKLHFKKGVLQDFERLV